jgi:hypothetical protein
LDDESYTPERRFVDEIPDYESEIESPDNIPFKSDSQEDFVRVGGNNGIKFDIPLDQIMSPYDKKFPKMQKILDTLSSISSIGPSPYSIEKISYVDSYSSKTFDRPTV